MPASSSRAGRRAVCRVLSEAENANSGHVGLATMTPRRRADPPDRHRWGGGALFSRRPSRRSRPRPPRRRDPDRDRDAGERRRPFRCLARRSAARRRRAPSRLNRREARAPLPPCLARRKCRRDQRRGTKFFFFVPRRAPARWPTSAWMSPGARTRYRGCARVVASSRGASGPSARAASAPRA